MIAAIGELLQKGVLLTCVSGAEGGQLLLLLMLVLWTGNLSAVNELLPLH